MSKRKKNVVDGAFLLIVSLLTICSVLKGEDLSNIAETITKARTFYLIMGVACVIFSIWAESTILHHLFGALHIKTKRRVRFMYSSVGFSFSYITPSAGGGQPVQVHYMRRNIAPVPVVTMVLMVVTITHKLVLATAGCLLVLFGRELLNRRVCEAMLVFYLGLTLNVVSCLTMLILAFHTSLAKNIMMKLPGSLVRLHILKDKISRTERLNMTIDHYNDTSTYLWQHKEVLIHVMLLTFRRRTALFSVTYFVYRAFELTGTHMTVLILLQSAISISANALPLPGGMGIDEHLFLTIFDSILYGDLLLPAVILSRGIAYYVQLVLSAAVTLIAHILIDKRQRRVWRIFRYHKNICEYC